MSLLPIGAHTHSRYAAFCPLSFSWLNSIDFYYKYELLFSHHKSSDYDRCISLHIRGEVFRFCARCTGIILGMLFTLLLRMLTVIQFSTLTFIISIIFSMIALLDWYLSNFNKELWTSNNMIRLFTGLFVGLFEIVAFVKFVNIFV